ncbi:MAG: MotA/TolQ/ExbB proton channel family protein, partial [Campylobacter sp.]|nr:MotA/TolQ/ExbB proton channel family protein [Campylobacter sp.]
MQNQNDFSDLALPKTQAGRSVFVFFKIIFFPFAIYVLALLSYLGFIDFQMKLHTVVMMSIILFTAILFTRHSAELAYSLFVSRIDDFKASLKEFIVSHLLEISGVKKSNAKFDEFLEIYTRDFRNDNLASIGAAVFPMLGILGTFISIAISMPSFSSSTSGELEKEIGVLLNGVGTAFYVSIYGIFLALWWMFFEKIGMSKFEKFTNDQKELSRQFFWQKDELEQRYMSAATNHFGDIRSIFARIGNEEFFNKLDETIDQKFNSYMQLQNLEKQIIGEAKIGLDQGINLLNKTAGKQDEFIKIHSDILKAISGFSTVVKDMELNLLTQYNKLEDISKDRSNTLEKSMSKFDQGLKALETSLKEFSLRLITEQENAMQAFKESMLQGVSVFKSAYEQEIKSGEHEKEREVLIAELKKSIDEIDKEASLIIQK